jgi:NADH dehydrogenase/NADH:ubiquinone oxidoreductase subunit G
MGELKYVNKSASCRICVVEIEGRRNLAHSCATPVAEGMVVRTNSKRVLRARRKILELFLSDHPFDCLSCYKSTDCELQRWGITLASTPVHIRTAKCQPTCGYLQQRD